MEQQKKKRGALLTIWLILLLIFNGITALSYLLGGEFIISLLPTVPMWAVYSLGIFALLNLVFTVFLFMWKRWAFFALIGSVGIVFIINLIIGTEIISAAFGLIGPVILYLILRSKWDLLE